MDQHSDRKSESKDQDALKAEAGARRVTEPSRLERV
jgi:hypothetical protein